MTLKTCGCGNVLTTKNVERRGLQPTCDGWIILVNCRKCGTTTTAAKSRSNRFVLPFQGNHSLKTMNDLYLLRSIGRKKRALQMSRCRILKDCNHGNYQLVLSPSPNKVATFSKRCRVCRKDLSKQVDGEKIFKVAKGKI